MSGLKGIKETKEAITGLLLLGSFVAERAKDGVKVDDATALVQKLIGDAEFKAVLQHAVQGIADVPAELKDISLTEAVELVGLLVPDLLKVVESLKK